MLIKNDHVLNDIMYLIDMNGIICGIYLYESMKKIQIIVIVMRKFESALQENFNYHYHDIYIHIHLTILSTQLIFEDIGHQLLIHQILRHIL